MKPSATSARAARRKKDKNGIAHPFSRPPKLRHPFFVPSLRAKTLRELNQPTRTNENTQ